MSSPSEGWYADPADATIVRWWDGARWTSHVQVNPAVPAYDAPAVPVYDGPSEADATRPDPAAAAAAMMKRSFEMDDDVQPRGPVGGSAANDSAELSIGARLLPPLPEKAEPAFALDPAPAPAPTRSKLGLTLAKPTRSVTLTVIVALIAIVAIGGGVYASGLLDSAPSRAASSDSVRVYEGDGYSVEVPNDWQEASGVEQPNVDAVFVAPNGAQLQLVRAEEGDTEISADEVTQAREVAFEVMVRVQLALMPGGSVISRDDATLGGETAERITLQGPGLGGVPYRVVEQGALRDSGLYLVAVGGTPVVVDAALAQFDQVVASFQFD